MKSLKDTAKILFTTNRLFPVNARRRRELFNEAEAKGMDSIPLFIINYNRLDCLKVLIDRLEEMGTTNINIIDNNSTYEPLLEYYDTLPYRIFRLDRNWGYKVFWECPIFEEYRKSFYILTDSDVVPVDACPRDYKYRLFTLLKKYPRLSRAGLSLKIDDLPKGGMFTEEVLGWEKQFFRLRMPGENAYLANIDTTFAMYAPSNIVTRTRSYSSVRTGYPMEAKHLPWYKMKGEVTEEDKYYSAHKTNGWWDANAGTATPDTEWQKEDFLKTIGKK